MAWRSHGVSNDDLVTKLKGNKVITSDRVEAAMRFVDRGDFCPVNCYNDAPQRIGWNTTISAPHMHAHALGILKDHLKDGARVLDIGTGSGYLTTCMAYMVGKKGCAIGIEHIKEINDHAISNVQKHNNNMLTSGQLIFLVGDGRLGCPQLAPYDAIHVGAASPTVPQALLQQLKNGGRLLIPVGPAGGKQFLEQYDKKQDGTIVKQQLMGVMFVALTDKEKQLPEGENIAKPPQSVAIKSDLALKDKEIQRLNQEILKLKQAHEQEIGNIVQTMEQSSKKVENNLNMELKDLQTLLQKSQEAERTLQRSLEQSQKNETSLDQELRRKDEVERELHEQLQEAFAALQAAKKAVGNRNWVIDSKEIEFSNEVLGKGSYGEVRIASFRGLKVAAKCLHEIILSDYNLSAFAREMEIASSVRHPNLVQFIGATKEGKAIIVLELMPTSLRKELENAESPLTCPQVGKIAQDVSAALNYLHLWKPSSIIHRDISSANVLLEPISGEQWKAKVSDYGSANLAHQISRTAAPGAPAYSAPEVVNPKLHSPAMDVYSFGVLLMEMITCEIPSGVLIEREAQAASIQSFQWQSFKPVVQQCIVRNHLKRPSMNEVLNTLLAL